MSKRVKDYDLMLWWAEDPENNLVEGRVTCVEGTQGDWTLKFTPYWNNTNFEFRKLVKPLVPRHHQKIAEMYFSDSGSVVTNCGILSSTIPITAYNPCWCPNIVYKITMSDGTKYTSERLTE